MDKILSEVQAELESDKVNREMPNRKKRTFLRGFLAVLGKIMLILLETVLLLAVALYGVGYVLAKGPSPTARDLFVMSVRETSAVGFLANIYFTDEEIAQIESADNTVEEYIETDTSLITITKPEDNPGQTGENQGPVADAWGLVDEDGDGIIIEQVSGEGFSGYMMVVQDPSRVIMGSVPTSYGARGYTVEQMVAQFDAVAGTNAGGFEDPDGKGNGSIPNSLVVFEGKIYYEGKGVQDGFVGLDDNNILHVGKLTAAQIKEKNIQYGCCFGPVLIANGESCDPAGLASGLNPRTAIGQRSDGAILMLVIDGRQAISMGATYLDLVDIFLEYGAVNACNLDGGSSSLMWYDGEYVNNCASVIGIRPVPTSFLVLKEGVSADG
ncbi:MAG: phosphodiester glycosidase family protein [Oscillospiraceae bacterium]|nr:phosphodiester glycosidase family protein [Oscillospiraceae bacterium]